jgi:hypothetical protein
VGEDLARPGEQGGDGLPSLGGAGPVPRGARLPPGGLRLQHLQRQLRATSGAHLQRGHLGDLVVAAVLSGNRNFEGGSTPSSDELLASPRWS